MKAFLALGAPLAAFAGLTALFLGGAVPPASAAGTIEIKVLSNRADLISGGDALVAIVLPAGVSASSIKVDVNGRDITSAFAIRPNGNFEGLVSGLAEGPNVLRALKKDRSGARITITNHPVGGSVLAGPQVQPYICGTTLGPPQDAQCNAPTRYTYYYRSTDPTKSGFQPYDPQSPPSDVATTTTDQGAIVPYIVRVEDGTADRGYYQIAVLFNPNKLWTPWAPQDGWNRKVWVSFGGDCKPWHQQPTATSTLEEKPLSRGFAVANSGQNKLGSDCNDVVSSEALMMLKEHLTESYGAIRYTMSNGCSGGSMQQNWIASNYPGLLDGIIPSCSFDDIWITMQEAEDCHVLDHYFDSTSPHLWAVPEQQAAVAGYASVSSCRTFWDGPNIGYAKTWFDPTNAAGCSSSPLPPPGVYDPQTNPGGIRCTLQDYAVSIWGRRASDGFANRIYDNVGVQYGLQALVNRKITAEQFVDLNEKVGGIDIDWKYTPSRSVADSAALVTAYRSGRVVYPREAAKVPIIDLRGSSNLEIHTDHHSYVQRARLDMANGNHDNSVIWTSGGSLAGDATATATAFDLMDRWLTAIHADGRSIPLEQKVVEDKPVDAVDACWVAGEKITDMTYCRVAFPYFADPRLVAGVPWTNNVLKCQLKPLEKSDYPPSTFTDAQWARLQAAFPTGVCNWNLPSVGFQPSVPWMTFEAGPGGQPLPPPPASVLVRRG
jgi:hypothetical protein